MAKRTSSDGKELEKMVSRIYETLKENPLVEVIHDYKITSPTGKKSQFDVAIKNKMMGFDFLALIECKDYKRAVAEEDIHVFGGKCNSVGGINKKIFVAVNGYQSGAKVAAQHHNVELYNLNEISSALIDNWIKWERSYTTHLKKGQIGSVWFHLQGRKITTYFQDSVPKINPDLLLLSPGVEPVILRNLISRIANEKGLINGLTQFASEDFGKLKIIGDERAVVIPIPLCVVPEVPYITVLEGCQVQVNQLEIVFEYIYSIAPFEDISTKSYQNAQGKTIAQVTSTKAHDVRIEIIRNQSNGVRNYYVINASGQAHKVDNNRVKEVRE